jgi:hypothetical protein
VGSEMDRSQAARIVGAEVATAQAHVQRSACEMCVR